MAVARFHIDFRGRENIDNFDKSRISEKITRFLEKFSREGEDVFLRVDFKQCKEQFRQKPKYVAKISLNYHAGRFNSHEEGWGAEQAVHNALDQLKKQILKKQGKLRTHANE